MKHTTMTDLGEAAQITLPADMTVAERRARWAALLAEHPGRVLTLDWIEYTPRANRAPLRGDNSAFAVAFADPVLRAAGLRDDTYGAIRDFFDLSHGQMHMLACRCHLGRSEWPTRTARRLQTMTERQLTPRLARFVGWLTGRTRPA